MQMWISAPMITAFTSIFYAPYISLIFTHHARCPWDSSLSTDEGVVSIWMNAGKHSWSCCRGPYTGTELCSWEGSMSKDGLGQAVLAPISKIKFCPTLLRLQLAGRANFCCLFSQCVNEAAELLLSGSPVLLSGAQLWTVTARAGKSCSVCSWTETGTVEGHRCLPKEAGKDRTLEAVFQIIANYAFIL